jgi:hypothetical protein
MLESVWIFYSVPQRSSEDVSLNSKFESWGEEWMKYVSGDYGVNSAWNLL